MPPGGGRPPDPLVRRQRLPSGRTGGAAAPMFAFAGPNRLPDARLPATGSRRTTIVLGEGVAVIAWPWALFPAVGTGIQLSHDDTAGTLFGGPPAVVSLAWLTSPRATRADADA